MNKESFTTAYRGELIARYGWAKDTDKLDKFIESVTRTLNGENTWGHDGEAVTAAWRIIGGKGKPTKKALRALP